MFYGLKEGSLDLPCGQLNYVAFGYGQKNLVIIQGLNVRDLKGVGSSLAWMYRKFAREYRVYLFDRRMHVRQGLTIQDLAADIALAMQALSVNTADVFGVSQGGMIAMALTLVYPELVSKLVLGVTAARSNPTIREAAARWISFARKRDYIAINRDIFSMMYTERQLKKYRLLMPLLVRLARPKDFDRFAILTSTLLDFDFYDRLTEICCPMLVLGADLDRITTGLASRQIAEKLGCQIHMYPDYGHAVYEEADFTDKVYSFLSK